MDLQDQDIDAGKAFAFNVVDPRVETKEFLGEPIQLNQDGDHIFIYCLDADFKYKFLHGLTFNTDWLPAGTESFTPGASILPDDLVEANVVLKDLSNWYYNGTQTEDGSILKPAFTDSNNWVGSDNPYQIGLSAAPRVSIMGLTSMVALAVWCLL